MKYLKIARCENCGKIEIITQAGQQPYCCNQPMTLLSLSSDVEKEDTHLPVITRKDGHLYAYAGSYEHEMKEDHLIEWMLLETPEDCRICLFQPGDEPKVMFQPGEAVIAVYAYCSKDGLWKTEI